MTEGQTIKLPLAQPHTLSLISKIINKLEDVIFRETQRGREVLHPCVADGVRTDGPMEGRVVHDAEMHSYADATGA